MYMYKCLSARTVLKGITGIITTPIILIQYISEDAKFQQS